MKCFNILVALACVIEFSSCSPEHNIWAVITTINHPTRTIKKLVDSGLHVVVVADKKTPVDWSCLGCEILSVQKQLELNYNIIKYLPWNHYCRKNIGYLYAIEHGATVIYDTDDDNMLNADKLTIEPINSSNMLCVFVYRGYKSICIFWSKNGLASWISSRVCTKK